MNNVVVVVIHNSAFTTATVYYYSETYPPTLGNYWHYDTDGVTPVVWQ